MKKLLFGTAGIPIKAKGQGTENGIRMVRKLGLNAMELEFVRNVNITEEKTPLIRKVAEANNITLTCHAPYYINLNSQEKTKLHASKNRILKSARIAWLCGGWSVCFHAGFYMKNDPAKVYETIKRNIKNVAATLQNENNKIWIRPELTGKATQFGNLKELLKLSEEVEQVMPCVDFSHYHARTGKFNSYEEFSETLIQIEKTLGREGLDNMHIHVSGIAYGEKGEKHHLNLGESDMNYQDLVKVWKEFNIKGVVISESPNIEEDALLLQECFLKL